MCETMIETQSMTPDQFRAWRKRIGKNQQDAGALIGISKESVGNYEAGRRRDGGEAPIPKTVELACAAVELGMTEYDGGPIEITIGRR
jgi:DNA-binding XRE family transcriptional regulator